jgi:DNA-binding LacI/PurR family transcriptional regulator
MAVSSKVVAKVEGVVHSTVSRALREHPAIPPDTIARIKQHAEDLGYIPSAVARGLKTNHSKGLGSLSAALTIPSSAKSFKLSMMRPKVRDRVYFLPQIAAIWSGYKSLSKPWVKEG